MTLNERITEDIVRKHFQSDPLFGTIKLEEQKSSTKRINTLLESASKSGSGMGKPEFIITFPSGNMDYLLVVECKASIAYHQSKHWHTSPQPKNYAVDGVLHYAKFLAQEYNVIAIAVSGIDLKELEVSTFVIQQKSTCVEECKSDRKLLSIHDYLKRFNDETFAENLKNIDIIKKAIFLNTLYNEYSIPEIRRCTMVSAFLLALLNESFRTAYVSCETAKELGNTLMNAIEHVLTKNNVRHSDKMISEYKTLLNEPLFSDASLKRIKHKDSQPTVLILKEVVRYLEKNVYPLMHMEENGFDVLGRFYTEFIRYAGTEQQQGLVLTPFHITDLFCDLAKIHKDSVIYDPCTGTGGFLIAGMKRMLALAGSDHSKKQVIKENQLVGVELRPFMFTYACSNMMLRGDGKSNIYCGDCFDLSPTIRKNHKPTVAFLNPPYNVGVAEQMSFIEHALDVVAPQNGLVVAIVQMSCGIKNEKELIAVKKRILKKHHLVATLSMPDDLFYPVGVVTTIMVFQSNLPNEGLKSWFGYFKNDGFEKRKHRGRVNARGAWDSIKNEWVKAYHNRDEVSGLSVKAEVTAEEEWCAEAYMETSYDALKDEDFLSKMKDFIAFQFLNNRIDYIRKDVLNGLALNMNTNFWKPFKYADVFEIKNGYYNRKPESSPKGDIPFIGATENQNGVTSYHTLEEIDYTDKAQVGGKDAIENKLFLPNCITVSNNGSVGCAFYQPVEFTCSHDVNVLYLKEALGMNVYIAQFLITLIEKEKYRWAYGRKWRPSRMPDSIIKLPVTKEGLPDWIFMENYIKSLPYSSSLI